MVTCSAARSDRGRHHTCREVVTTATVVTTSLFLFRRGRQDASDAAAATGQDRTAGSSGEDRDAGDGQDRAGAGPGQAAGP